MLSRALLKAKVKATAIHVTLSLVIFGVLLFVMLTRWYPGIYFTLDGGWQGVRIMLFVDVVLGPALTFLVFNPAKSRREMAVDFSFIGIVQLAAVLWGIHAVHAQRPLALAFNASQLFTVRAASFAKQGFPIEDLRKIDARRWPAQVYAEPRSDEEARRTFDRLMKEGLAESQQVDLYEPWDAHLEEILKAGATAEHVTKNKPAVKAELDAFLRKHGGKPDDYAYLLFMGEYAQGWIILDRKGEIAGTLDMQPL